MTWKIAQGYSEGTSSTARRHLSQSAAPIWLLAPVCRLARRMLSATSASFFDSSLPPYAPCSGLSLRIAARASRTSAAVYASSLPMSTSSAFGFAFWLRLVADKRHMNSKDAEGVVRLESLESVSELLRGADSPVVLCGNVGSGFSQIMGNLLKGAQVTHVFRLPESVPAGTGFVLMKTFIGDEEDAKRLSRLTWGKISPEQSSRLSPYRDPAGYAFPPVRA